METNPVLSATAAILLVAGASGAGPLCAQAAAGDKGGTERVGCFRGRQLPACKSFWIFEIQTHTPLIQTERELTFSNASSLKERAFGSQLEWNLGHMLNVGPSWAVGGALTLGTGGGDPLTGIEVRARRWVSSDVSIEAEAGILRTEARSSLDGIKTGATADVRLNIRDDGAFFVRWDGVGLPEETRAPSYYHDPGGFQQALSIGVGLGSKPALWGTGAIGLGFLVTVALLARYLGN